MRRLAPPLLVAVALFAGCGESSEETTTIAPTKSVERRLRSAFLADPGCRPRAGASRWGCSIGSYRCQGVVTGRGWSVSCAKPGRSIAFRVRPG
jgi:hypothetical protein